MKTALDEQKEFYLWVKEQKEKERMEWVIAFWKVILFFAAIIGILLIIQQIFNRL